MKNEPVSNLLSSELSPQSDTSSNTFDKSIQIPIPDFSFFVHLNCPFTLHSNDSPEGQIVVHVARERDRDKKRERKT
jgi:hypothetical protein